VRDVCSRGRLATLNFAAVKKVVKKVVKKMDKKIDQKEHLN
jgi:hypothetical protein